MPRSLRSAASAEQRHPHACKMNSTILANQIHRASEVFPVRTWTNFDSIHDNTPEQTTKAYTLDIK